MKKPTLISKADLKRLGKNHIAVLGALEEVTIQLEHVGQVVRKNTRVLNKILEERPPRSRVVPSRRVKINTKPK